MMSPEEIENKIEEWHQDGHGKDTPLHEYLGWTWPQYKRWFETGETPE